MRTNKSKNKTQRQSVQKNLRNRQKKSEIKTLIKNLRLANASNVLNIIRNAAKVISKASSKGIIHKKNASRKISRMSKKASIILKSL